MVVAELLLPVAVAEQGDAGDWLVAAVDRVGIVAGQQAVFERVVAIVAVIVVAVAAVAAEAAAAAIAAVAVAAAAVVVVVVVAVVVVVVAVALFAVFGRIVAAAAVAVEVERFAGRDLVVQTAGSGVVAHCRASWSGP
jgi:hypothetical protein